MLGQLKTEVNKAVAFHVKELLLTKVMTRCNKPDLINQVCVTGAIIDLKP